MSYGSLRTGRKRDIELERGEEIFPVTAKITAYG